MGAAGSVDNLTVDQKTDLFDDFLNQAKAENSDLEVSAVSNDDKVAKFTVEFARQNSVSDVLLKKMEEECQSIATANQTQKVSASQLYREKNGKVERVVMEGIGREAGQERKWRYQPGDAIKFQSGRTAFTVRKSLGCGAFGEVHVVWQENQQRERAMKLTKFDSMTREKRISMFRPMCEEALLGVDLQHHPNIISLRFIKVAGDEFLVIMDLVDGASELQDAYESNKVWNSIDGGRANWTTPPTVKITSVMAMLWYQLCNAISHLHRLKIMHCDVKPENVLVNTKDLHLYLFDMGLARRGETDANGVLTVECDGCTPAYAGPEVLDLFAKFNDGMSKDEKTALQQAHPIDITCHDLWASALTIFQAVYTIRDGVWAEGRAGPSVLEKYWNAQILKKEIGTELKDWTVEQVKAVAESWPLKEKSKPKVMAALEKNHVDGKYLLTIEKKADLKKMKGLTVGARTEVWVQLRPYTALPFDESLYKIMKKVMAPTRAERYQSAQSIMDALLPVIDAAADVSLRNMIPTSPKEKVSQDTQISILVNIGIALSNHGYFEAARSTYRRVLEMQPDRMTALKGWAATLSHCQIWDNDEQSSKLCERGVQVILEKVEKENATGNLTQKAIGQSYSALWALCYGNGQNAEVVAAYPGFMKSLSLVLDACIQDGKANLTALMTVGVSGSVCVGSSERRNIMIDVGVPDRIKGLLEVYAADTNVNIEASTVMKDVAIDDQSRAELTQCGAVAQLISNWRTHHTEDPIVCYTVLNKLYNFTFGQLNALKEMDVQEFARQSMEKHHDNVPVQKFGKKLLSRFK